MRVLVTGGAGYIGSHVVKALGLQGHDITIYDNLSTGNRKAVLYGELVVGDLKESEKLERLFSDRKFEAVLHFAGSIVVPESVAEPLRYYENNTVNTHLLLTLCQKYQINKFIFSSTAAVYGMPDDGICGEDSPLSPINPYGRSKLMSEEMLRDLSDSSDFKHVILRYFNVSGADPEGLIGQSFPGATHLIKVACETACGRRDKIDIFGTDYPTPDGTCVRDYIHVSDLADAHVKALKYLEDGGSSATLNCGYGAGYSVREILERVRKITGVNFTSREVGRRLGDPSSLTSRADRIKTVIGWTPRYNDLDTIIRSAYEWEKMRTY